MNDKNKDTETNPSPVSADSAPSLERFPVVGLGASAGGLHALEEFFENMSVDSGCAFVVVTHQHIGQKSMLAELLQRKSGMPVTQIRKATRVEPNHVYTALPGFLLSIKDGELRPNEAGPGRPASMPIDYFLRSLALACRERSVGIILSGTGSDGSLGIKEIKAALGMVMVQDEASAQYDGMPHSAIASGQADYVLPPAQMPVRLLKYLASGKGASAPPGATVFSSEEMAKIFAEIGSRRGVDFSNYKPSTMARRIERRMKVHGLESLERYLAHLQTAPAEVDQLFNDLLIGVTSFFRDPEAWASLEEQLKKLLVDKPDDYLVRAWVPGCSTGEEAYSLAILLRECMDAIGRTLSVQVFATDLDCTAIDKARSGLFPLGIVNDVSATRLARFFSQESDGYRVKKEIRDMLVFAEQNLLADPPFTKLDVLCCRNLLIYLDATSHKKLFPIFHYGLRRDGILFLGSAESIGSFSNLFTPLDKKWKLFRSASASASELSQNSALFLASSTSNNERTLAVDSRSQSASAQLSRTVEKMLLKDLVPPTVLVRERGDVVHVHGRTGLFLEPAEGLQAAPNIFNMVRPGLQIVLASALREATASDTEIVKKDIHVRTNGKMMKVNLRVLLLRQPQNLHGLYRVTFESVEAPSPVPHPQSAEPIKEPSAIRVSDLERELRFSREGHQNTIEELEATNEELKSTNEELQSTNEELQSTNEELETSKEEMQSLNEELQTVNAQLQSKVEELSRTSNDMKNLLDATDIATIFLDTELRITRFTEPAKKVVRLISTDVGRPLADLASSLRYESLSDDAREVLRTLQVKESEMSSDNGTRYLVRILPYRTVENVIDGLVVTFVNIGAIKKLQEEQARLLEALRNSSASVFGQDSDLKIVWAGSRVFDKEPDDLIGKTDQELFSGDDAENLTKLKKEALSAGVAQTRRMELGVGSERRLFDMYVEPTRGASGEVTGLSCLAIDITSVAKEDS